MHQRMGNTDALKEQARASNSSYIIGSPVTVILFILRYSFVEGVALWCVWEAE